MTPARDGAVDLTIIGGFLGAGKTTLINGILRNAGGRRLAVLVNDFGEINIDEKLIARQSDRVISLTNGCICCDLGDNIYQTLFRMLEPDIKPDGIVIETSGVADPAKLAVIGRIGKFFRLNATIVMIDAANVRTHSADRYLSDTILRQIAAADLLIVNKADMVSGDALSSLEAWLGEIAPKAATIRAVRGDLPIDVVLGTRGDGRTTPDIPDHDHHGHDVHHGDVFASWSFSADRPFSSAALRDAVGELPPWIVRGKGVLWIDDSPDRSVIFHLVGGRAEFSKGAPWGDDVPRSQLVFIATAQPTRDFAPCRTSLQEALTPS